MTSTASTFLRTVDLFGDLSDDEVDEIGLMARPFERAPGAFLFRQGDDADAMYCIEEGEVRITVRVAGEEEAEVGRAVAGAVVGEMGLIDADVRSATGEALAPTRGYRIERRSFEVLRAAFRPSSCKVVRRLAQLVASRLYTTTYDLYGMAEAPRCAPNGRGPAQGGAGGGKRRSGRGADLDNVMRLPVFGAFSRDELERVLDEMVWREVPRGHVLFEPGDAAASCFVVVRGAVEATVLRAGRTEKIALWGPGRMVGEEALFVPTPRAVRATAREDSHLLEVDATRFRALFDATSPLAYKLSDAATQQMVVALRSLNRRRAWLMAHRGEPFHFFK